LFAAGLARDEARVNGSVDGVHLRIRIEVKVARALLAGRRET
jgi:hypothetical protein